MKISAQILMQSSKWFKPPMLSAAYRDWLINSGSLTTRLKERYSDFAVKPLKLEYSKAMTDELKVLGLKTNQRVLIREVLLFGNNQPVVFAHSVIPRVSLRGSWNGLGRLGNKPLGATLFANPKVKRTPLRYKKLSPHHALYQHATEHLIVKPAHLWARRSIFSLSSARILVTEIFLPKLLE